MLEFGRSFAICLLAVACAACTRSTGSSDSANGTYGGDPPARAARLTDLAGDVSLEPSGADSWSRATTNATVTTGDRLYTGPRARAELDIGQYAARLDQNSDVTVTNMTDHFTQLGVEQGAVDASIYRWVPTDSMELDTPNGALMPLAAGVYRLSVEPDDNATLVTVERGSLELTGPGVDQTLTAGQTVRLVGTNPIQIVPLASQVAATSFDRWSATRDEVYTSPASTVTTRYVNERVPGWEDLAANGTWITTPSYGEVWCPSHVAADWVPYREGHWSWVEPWGWTWVEDEPWGFTPFHYGRWAHLATTASCSSAAWAWVPGPVAAEPVYAPALVSFIDAAALALGAAAAPQGWFPLAPAEPFFPWYHHSDDYLRAVNISNLRTITNVDRLIRARDLTAVRWANRADASTVVPDPVFRAGGPVARGRMHISPERLAAVPVAPHPSVNPGPRMLAGGPPAPRPPVSARPHMVVTRAAPNNAGSARAARGRTAPSGPVAAVPQVGAPTRAAPLITRNPPQSQRRIEQVPAAGEVARPAGPARAARPSMAAPRPIITRNAPPAPRPSRAAQMPAMQAHPGRPPEPQQLQRIHNGRTAGRPPGVEVPAHAAPPPPAAPGRGRGKKPEG